MLFVLQVENIISNLFTACSHFSLKKLMCHLTELEVQASEDQVSDRPIS